jgi:hypothetical protein
MDARGRRVNAPYRMQHPGDRADAKKQSFTVYIDIDIIV